MLDARNVYRKVSRAIFDFSPEQQKNIAAIVWLYRGQSDRFLQAGGVLPRTGCRGRAGDRRAAGDLREDPRQADRSGRTLCDREARSRPADRNMGGTHLRTGLRYQPTSGRSRTKSRREPPTGTRVGTAGTRDNAALHAAREGMHDMAERCRDLTKQIDLAAKLAGRAVDIAVKELEARESDLWANSDVMARRAGRSRTHGPELLSCFGGRATSCGRPTGCRSGFPEAELRDVEGLVKLVDRSEIEAHDWSLTPGRYVGVAPRGGGRGF